MRDGNTCGWCWATLNQCNRSGCDGRQRCGWRGPVEVHPLLPVVLVPEQRAPEVIR